MKHEVVTQTERGTLIQLDGTETDLQGNPIHKPEPAKVEVKPEPMKSEPVKVEPKKK